MANDPVLRARLGHVCGPPPFLLAGITRQAWLSHFDAFVVALGF
jgi:hypothetical protein